MRIFESLVKNEIKETTPEFEVKCALHQINHAVLILSQPANYAELCRMDVTRINNMVRKSVQKEIEERKERDKQPCRQAYFGLAYNIND